MTTVFRIMLCALAGAVMLVHPAVAQESGGHLAHRWGVGWDDGVAMRYWLSEDWGIGVSLAPKFSDNTSQADESSDSQTTLGPPATTSSSSMSASVMLFRELRIVDWLGVGPYIRIKFGYGESKSDRTYSDETHVWGLAVSHRADFEIGIRPSFSYKDRFVLESRFGFGLTRLTSDNWSHTRSPSLSNDRLSQVDDWSGYSYGEKLGPGSVLQFIIYF